MEDLIGNTKRKILVKYPRFATEISESKIVYKDNLKYHTAATDGKNIYVDSNYFKELSEDDRMFLIAHEILHIKFMHMLRLEDKNGVKRDISIWNEATDAIINANLERDGFSIKEGYVNRPEALGYSAEEFYEILLKEKQSKQEKQKSEGNESEKNGKQEGGNSSQSMNETGFGDDHSMWEEAFENYKTGKEDQETSKNQSKNKGQSSKEKKETEGDREKQEEQKSEKSNEENLNDDNTNPVQSKGDSSYGNNFGSYQGRNLEDGDNETTNPSTVNEDAEFKSNRKEKIRKFKEANLDDAQLKIEEMARNLFPNNQIGKSSEEIDWERILKRYVEKNEINWSKRRAIAENNYAYRLEEVKADNGSTTEVMIDVSGSISNNLVKGFLRQIKPILLSKSNSKLKVGCFDTQFYGFAEIKSEKDIDNFRIPGGGGTDLDLPVRNFTKDSKISKIIFTDGYGGMPREDLRKENVVWLVYGNKNFEPCCGKVIPLSDRQITAMEKNINQITYEEDR